jgi:hypothetical protein
MLRIWIKLVKPNSIVRIDISCRSNVGATFPNDQNGTKKVEVIRLIAETVEISIGNMLDSLQDGRSNSIPDEVIGFFN